MITKREGLILYLCEGDKFEGQRLHMVAVTSTEPIVLKLFISWLRIFYNIKIEKLKARIHLWPSSDEEQCKNFWSKELGISAFQFTKSYFKNKNGKNQKFPHGVCRIGFYNKKIFQTNHRRIKESFG